MTRIKILPVMALAAAIGFGASQSAFADVVVFDNNGLQPGGTLTFGTLPTDNLQVQNAAISLVANTTNLANSPIANTGAFACGQGVGAGTQGCLNFTTGTFNNFNGTDTYTYNGGGSLSINGDATAAGVAGLLFLGDFASGTTLQVNSSSGTATFQGTLNAAIFNPTLAAFLGVQVFPVGGVAHSQFAFVATGVLGGSGNVTVSDVSLEAISTDTGVPEPASMLLLGTGLVGLGARLRRSKKA